MMTHRQRILAAIRRQPVDRIPTDIWMTEEVRQRLYAHLGVDNTVALYDALDIDGIPGVKPPYSGPPLATQGDYWEDEWGFGYRKQDYGSGVYNELVHNPLATAETIADLRSFAWPSPDWYDYSALPDLAAQWPDRAVQCGYSAVFYWHNRLRGLEQSLVDPLAKPAFSHYLIARVSDFFAEYHRRCFAAAGAAVHVTQVTDDFGSQHGLLISPRVFDTFYRAPVQHSIDLAREFALHVFHHDDGDMRPLLPTLVEMGIGILNPIQWRCGDWDLAQIKAQFGRRLCFHGGVDNQQTLPFGAPDDVRREVRWLMQTLAGDGTGLILAPCHNLQAFTPIENILAMYEAARDYGAGVLIAAPPEGTTR